MDLPPAQSGPLATVNAHVVVTTPFDSELTRVALVWMPVVPGQGKYQAVQKVTTRPGARLFDWRIEVNSLPPASVIDGMAASGMRYGQAELVVYEDHNGNDELDTHAVDEEPADIVVGRAPAVRLWWGAGKPAESTQLGQQPIAPGFSVTYGPTSVDPEPDDCKRDTEDPTFRVPCRRVPKDKAADVKPAQPVQIVISRDPVLQSYPCRGFWGTTADRADQWPDDTPGWKNRETLGRLICDGPGCGCKGSGCALDLPLKGRENLIRCNVDQTAYVWKDCIQDPNACDTTFCHYGHGERIAGQPIPADWPACP